MLRTLESLGDLRHRRVLVRCDLNVPLDDGRITDDGRIVASLTTLRRLIEAEARVVVLAHLGRPRGRERPELSLEPVAVRLAELLDQPVTFSHDTVGEPAERIVDDLGDGDVALLENVRFDPRETSDDAQARDEFAAELARLGEVFVSDGFGVVHRDQASVCELARRLPSVAGALVEAESRVLEQLTREPKHPYTVVLGGSKVSDKLGVIEHLLPRVDSLLIGGGMMFTFLAAQGHAVGSSLLEADQFDAVRGYLDDAAERGVELVLPSDVVVAERFAADAAHVVRDVTSIEDTDWASGGLGLDIGPATAEDFARRVRRSQTVFWNGPMGVFEFDAFSAGTRAVAGALTEVAGLGVVGGGDSAAAIRSLGFAEDRFGHVSTGGGASLEFLEGRSLPGLEVLGWEP